jgi:anti-sigma factor (TIGR02949 family)
MSGAQTDGTTEDAVGGNCAEGSGNCSEALRDLERYLDGELPESDLGSIRDHLAACYPCADRATFEEQLRAIVRERCVERTPPDLHAAIRERLDVMSGDPGPNA